MDENTMDKIVSWTIVNTCLHHTLEKNCSSQSPQLQFILQISQHKQPLILGLDLKPSKSRNNVCRRQSVVFSQ